MIILLILNNTMNCKDHSVKVAQKEPFSFKNTQTKGLFLKEYHI